VKPLAIIMAAASSAAALPALAQTGLGASVELATDERRRGISWSDGKLSPAASVNVGVPFGLDLDARVTGTRGDPRHGGADAVFDLTGGFTRDIGSGLRVNGFATGHLFAGAAEALDYAELGLGASFALGPGEVGLDARYAPDQRAIGGDNLWVGARARVGVPATPFTFNASVGRSTGSVDDPRHAPVTRLGDVVVGQRCQSHVPRIGAVLVDIAEVGDVAGDDDDVLRVLGTLIEIERRHS